MPGIKQEKQHWSGKPWIFCLTSTGDDGKPCFRYLLVYGVEEDMIPVEWVVGSMRSRQRRKIN